MIFDGGQYLLQNVDQDSPLFTPHFFYVRNYYDSLCLTPREAHLEVPYIHRDIPNGLSYQDWQFAMETMAMGWKHVVVPDTIIFKRRRDFSLVTESNTRRSVLRSLPGDGDRPDPRPGPVRAPGGRPRSVAVELEVLGVDLLDPPDQVGAAVVDAPGGFVRETLRGSAATSGRPTCCPDRQRCRGRRSRRARPGRRR